MAGGFGVSQETVLGLFSWSWVEVLEPLEKLETGFEFS